MPDTKKSGDLLMENQQDKTEDDADGQARHDLAFHEQPNAGIPLLNAINAEDGLSRLRYTINKEEGKLRDSRNDSEMDDIMT